MFFPRSLFHIVGHKMSFFKLHDGCVEILLNCQVVGGNSPGIVQHLDPPWFVLSEEEDVLHIVSYQSAHVSLELMDADEDTEIVPS